MSPPRDSKAKSTTARRSHFPHGQARGRFCLRDARRTSEAASFCMDDVAQQCTQESLLNAFFAR